MSNSELERDEKKCYKLNILKLSRLATIGVERSQHYFVPVLFTFDGNNIFILIDNNPKNLKNYAIFKRIKNIQKNTNCNSISTLRSMWNSKYARFKTSLETMKLSKYNICS